MKFYQQYIKNYSSQKELAQKIGKSKSFLGKLSRGDKQPSLKTLDDLAAVLGISVSHLVKEVKNEDTKG
jgi:transcriptional regulator with XRE-family HTH domain